MKIWSSPGVVPGERRRAGRASSVSGFALIDKGSTPSARAGPATSLSSAGSILTVQEVTSREAGGRRQAAAHGHEVLDELRGLHLGMIDGWVAEEDLRRLAEAVDKARPGTDDPRLEAVLEEIETRAAVELAKLGR